MKKYLLLYLPISFSLVLPIIVLSIVADNISRVINEYAIIALLPIIQRLLFFSRDLKLISFGTEAIPLRLNNIDIICFLSVSLISACIYHSSVVFFAVFLSVINRLICVSFQKQERIFLLQIFQSLFFTIVTNLWILMVYDQWPDYRIVMYWIIVSISAYGLNLKYGTKIKYLNNNAITVDWNLAFETGFAALKQFMLSFSVLISPSLDETGALVAKLMQVFVNLTNNVVLPILNEKRMKIVDICNARTYSTHAVDRSWMSDASNRILIFFAACFSYVSVTHAALFDLASFLFVSLALEYFYVFLLLLFIFFIIPPYALVFQVRNQSKLNIFALFTCVVTLLVFFSFFPYPEFISVSFFLLLHLVSFLFSRGIVH